MTRQASDLLLYEKQEYYLNVEILNEYFKKYPDKYFKSESCNTSLWRGYIAVFEIKKDLLYVKKIKILTSNNFRKLNDFCYKEPCDWFTGLIRIDDFKGEFDDEDNMEAVFEYLEIKNGVLRNHYRLKFDEFKRFKNSLFKRYKKTPEFQKELAVWHNAGLNITESKKIISKNFLRYYREI